MTRARRLLPVDHLQLDLQQNPRDRRRDRPARRIVVTGHRDRAPFSQWTYVCQRTTIPLHVTLYNACLDHLCASFVTVPFQASNTTSSIRQPLRLSRYTYLVSGDLTVRLLTDQISQHAEETGVLSVHLLVRVAPTNVSRHTCTCCITFTSVAHIHDS